MNEHIIAEPTMDEPSQTEEALANPLVADAEATAQHGIDSGEIDGSPLEANSSLPESEPLDSPATSGQLELFDLTPFRAPAPAFNVAPEISPELFARGFPPLPPLAPPRHPNLADAGFFGLMMILGLVVSTSFLGLALHFHWLEHWMGLKTFADAASDTHLALATQLAIYLIGLAAAIPFFRMAWGTGYFEGIHWHGATAARLRYRLIATAFVCNVIAMAGNLLLPFPDHAPIDKLFGTSTDAWLLFAFGVTAAPFFEEMIFRGFLLPAMATAWDWAADRMTGRMNLRITDSGVTGLSGSDPFTGFAPGRPSHIPSRGLDAEGNPIWSTGAMVFASLLVSAPFALMHSEQVGQAWGPLILLYCVSLILCATRLRTRSLAASTMVHSAYNFMLFSIMLIESGGFRHLDKL